MKANVWTALKNWLSHKGIAKDQVATFESAIADVERFFATTDSFPGWDHLTATDGRVYLTALSRAVPADSLRHKWAVLTTVDEGLSVLEVNSQKPFDPLHLFLTSLKDERQYSAATVKAYATDIRDCRKAWAKAGIDHHGFDIDQADVTTYLLSLRKRHLKQNTVLRKLSSLRTYYQFLEQNHLVAANPWELVTMKKRPEDLPRYLYPPEVKALVQTARGKGERLDFRNLAIVEILLETGMRVGELCQLTIDNIDDSLKIILVNGKGGKQRYLPLGAEVEAAINDYLKKCRQPLMARYHQSHHYLIVNQYGGQITEAGITYILNQLIDRSSLTGHIHPHMLRHTFASTMLNNGGDIRSVQELLGHASLSTTQIYTHITSKRLQDSYQQFFSRARKDEAK